MLIPSGAVVPHMVGVAGPTPTPHATTTPHTAAAADTPLPAGGPALTPPRTRGSKARRRAAGRARRGRARGRALRRQRSEKPTNSGPNWDSNHCACEVLDYLLPLLHDCFPSAKWCFRDSTLQCSLVPRPSSPPPTSQRHSKNKTLT